MADDVTGNVARLAVQQKYGSPHDSERLSSSIGYVTNVACAAIRNAARERFINAKA
jgi:hypothetical protein